MTMLQCADVTGRSPGETAFDWCGFYWQRWILRKKPTTKRYEIRSSLRLSFEGGEWRQSISGSLFFKLQVSVRIVTDTKYGQLKPTSATLSRTMMDNTCLPGEPKVSFLVLPSSTTSEHCVKRAESNLLDSKLRYICNSRAELRMLTFFYMLQCLWWD